MLHKTCPSSYTQNYIFKKGDLERYYTSATYANMCRLLMEEDLS